VLLVRSRTPCPRRCARSRVCSRRG